MTRRARNSEVGFFELGLAVNANRCMSESYLPLRERESSILARLSVKPLQEKIRSKTEELKIPYVQKRLNPPGSWEKSTDTFL